MVTLFVTQINISACLTQHTSALGVSDSCREVQTTAENTAVSRYAQHFLLSAPASAGVISCWERASMHGFDRCDDRPYKRLCQTCLKIAMASGDSSQWKWGAQVQQVEAACEMLHVMLQVKYHIAYTTEMVIDTSFYSHPL